MGTSKANYRQWSLFWVLIFLISGYLVVPGIAQSSNSNDPLTRRRPVMRRHTLSTYYERNYFKRVEQAASNLDPRTVSNLYARSSLHIRRGNSSSITGTERARVPAAPYGHPSLTTRGKLLPNRARLKKATVQPTSPDAEPTTSGEQTTIQTGLPDGILTPIPVP